MSEKNGYISIYNIGEERCAASHSFGPAVRGHYLLHMVLEGGGVYRIDNREYRVGMREGFLIPPDIITYYEADSLEPWHYLWIGFMGAGAPELAERCGISRKQPIFAITDVQRGAGYIREARGYSASAADYFSLLSSFYGFMSLVRGADYRGGDAGTAALVRSYIEKNFSYRITVSELADMFAISRSQLFRVFKAEYGVSVQDYLVDYRLVRAAGMMGRADMSVSEIMYSCGFNDLPYFSKRFKDKYGVSPAIYRKRTGPAGCRSV